MLDDMVAAFDATDADDAVRAVIVTGSGRAFCAGADLSGRAARPSIMRRAAAGTAANRRCAPTAASTMRIPAVRDGGGILALRIFASPQTGDRRDQRPRGRRRRDDDAADGFPPGERHGALRLRLRAARHRARGGVELVPAASRRHRAGAANGAIRARCSTRPRRCRAGWSAASTRPKICLPAARALARELTGESAPVSVALTRRMLWTGLGAAHPMEAHRIESRAIWARGASARCARGRRRPSSKSASRVFPDRVSEAWADFADWFEDPDLSMNAGGTDSAHSLPADATGNLDSAAGGGSMVALSRTKIERSGMSDGGFMVAEALPADWREGRFIGRIAGERGPQPGADRRRHRP